MMAEHQRQVIAPAVRMAEVMAEHQRQAMAPAVRMAEVMAEHQRQAMAPAVRMAEVMAEHQRQVMAPAVRMAEVMAEHQRQVMAPAVRMAEMMAEHQRQVMAPAVRMAEMMAEHQRQVMAPVVRITQMVPLPNNWGSVTSSAAANLVEAQLTPLRLDSTYPAASFLNTAKLEDLESTSAHLDGYQFKLPSSRAERVGLAFAISVVVELCFFVLLRSADVDPATPIGDLILWAHRTAEALMVLFVYGAWRSGE
jgi:autonomous glycyl radical cofactor GrcA